VLLAGLWITATHIPLLLDAAPGRNNADWVFLPLAQRRCRGHRRPRLLWSVSYWQDLAAIEAEKAVGR